MMPQGPPPGLAPPGLLPPPPHAAPPPRPGNGALDLGKGSTSSGRSSKLRVSARGTVKSSSGPSRSKSDRRPPSQKDLIECVHFCLKAWHRSHHTLADKVRADPRLHRAKNGGDGVSSAAVPLNRSPTDVTNELLAEASAMLGACSSGPMLTTPAMERNAELVGVVRVGIEQELRKWWNGNFEKAVRAQLATGDTISDPLSQILQQPDAEVSAIIAEQLKPARQQVEQHLQADLRSIVAAAVEEQMSVVVRESGDMLEAAVEASVREAATTWKDENMGLVAARMRKATAADALTADASVSVAAGVRSAIALAAAGSPAAQPSAQVSSSATSPAAVRVATKLRGSMAQLEATMNQMDDDVAGIRACVVDCKSAIGRVRLDALGVKRGKARGGRTPSREDMQKSAWEKCKSRQYEGAIREALAWDDASTGSPGESLTGWLCREVLLSGENADGFSPEAFLAVDPCPIADDELRLQLLSTLLRHAVAGSELQSVDIAVQWALALGQALEPGPWQRGAPSERALASAIDALGQISRMTGPPALVSAGTSERTLVARCARMALKQLELLRRFGERSS